MKKILILLNTLTISLISCTSPKFQVTTKNKTSVEKFNYCLYGIKPINKVAHKINSDNLCDECQTYAIGDTITVTRKKYTNY